METWAAPRTVVRRKPLVDKHESEPHIMNLIVIVIILVLLFGGGGGYYAHSQYGLPGLGGALGTVLIVLVVVWLLGR